MIPALEVVLIDISMQRIQYRMIYCGASQGPLLGPPRRAASTGAPACLYARFRVPPYTPPMRATCRRCRAPLAASVCRACPSARRRAPATARVCPECSHPPPHTPWPRGPGAAPAPALGPERVELRRRCSGGDRAGHPHRSYPHPRVWSTSVGLRSSIGDRMPKGLLRSASGTHASDFAGEVLEHVLGKFLMHTTPAAMLWYSVLSRSARQGVGVHAARPWRVETSGD